METKSDNTILQSHNMIRGRRGEECMCVCEMERFNLTAQTKRENW